MSRHGDSGAPPPAVNPHIATLLNSTSTMITSMSNSFALQGVLSQIKPFTGYNVPLKDFVEDIKAGGDLLPEDAEEAYVRALVGKLKGAARDSIYGHPINTLDELITHLKKRFTPNHDYSYYSARINDLHMNQGERVGTFYDRLNILLHGARAAIIEEEGEQAENVINLLMKPLEKAAIRTYIRGLPVAIACEVRSAKPVTLEAAYKEAVEMENDLDANLLPDTRYKDYRNAPRPWTRKDYHGAPRSWEREEYTAAHTPQPRNRYHEPPNAHPIGLIRCVQSQPPQHLNSRRARHQDPRSTKTPKWGPF